jgi:hypothetical protein
LPGGGVTASAKIEADKGDAKNVRRWLNGKNVLPAIADLWEF